MIDLATVLTSCISGAVVGIATDLLYWKLATGGWPWATANKKGKYVIIEDWDENTGRFKGSLNIPVNDVLGLTDRSIMKFQLEEKDKQIRELSVKNKSLELDMRDLKSTMKKG